MCVSENMNADVTNAVAVYDRVGIYSGRKYSSGEYSAVGQA